MSNSVLLAKMDIYVLDWAVNILFNLQVTMSAGEINGTIYHITVRSCERLHWI